ncbi:glycosyltransferase family 2 protein [Thermosynechococcaceae cyanobacterium BACA0444]|uniref:Glycosyltransferase family 2 protein n=1 Tax=Pseudocalidococcus azoricus BACA0444 TaxID=2918990 RepID=A0AAE4JV37_9CYAN|nr:glycosyltransferase family 2 protein [Pseudocalidococcus azoricus]MDS3859980.1 glycosyltransferase family 2 protein [Pseudocalidococcus azoricus BACA0444]
MPDNTPVLSLVVPCYNEAANLAQLFTRIAATLAPLGLDYEVICVNDGSRDHTLAQLIEQHQQDPRIKVINFSRNFGKEIALTAGIDHSQGRAVIPLDADLQDPPELIPEMVSRWQEGFDVVYATRRTRTQETWIKRITAQGFYRVMAWLSDTPIPANTGDFRLLDRAVVNVLKQLPERNRFMKGLFSWVGFRQTVIHYDRPGRLQGESSWNYWRLWNFALDGIVGFSVKPLKIWLYVGLLISLLALIYAGALVFRTLIYGRDIPGYASLMVAILFLGGIQLLTLGIMGEYLGRIYAEVKGRPLYIIRDAYGFAPHSINQFDQPEQLKSQESFRSPQAPEADP